jgi:hypothetical protein
MINELGSFHGLPDLVNKGAMIMDFVMGEEVAQRS